MGPAIVCFAMLFVFFMRDVPLLAAVPRRNLPAALALYGVVNTGCVAALIAIVTADNAPSPLQLVHASPFWVVCICWHGLIWLFCVFLGRKGRPDLAWIAALLPTPVLLVALAGAALLIRYTTDAIGPIGLAMLVPGAWWAIVSAAVLGHRWRPGLFGDSRSALDFAGMSNTTALVLVPFNGLVRGL